MMIIILITFISFFIISASLYQTGHALYFGNDMAVTNKSVSSSLSLFPEQLTSTENGNLYFGWIDKNSTYITSKHENQRKFQKPLPLNQDNSFATFLQVSATERGDVYVVWANVNNKTGDSSIQFTSSNNSGITFSTKKELSSGKSISFSPQLAVTERGDVYVVWANVNNKTGDSSIQFTSSNNSGITFSTKKEIRGGNTLTSSPEMVATEKGDVHVVWVDKSIKTGDSDINLKSSHDNGRSFDDRKRLRSNNLLSSTPQMAATESGQVYVVWSDRNSTTSESRISFRASYDGGRTFDSVINLDKDRKDFLNSSSPQLAVGGNGTVYVVWVDDQIQFKEILINDAIVGSSISLSNKTTSSLSPQLTVASNGNGYVFWIDKSSTMERSIHSKKISEYLFDRNY